MGPNYARLFVGYVASKRYIDDIAWWGQLCAGGINSRTLLTLFLTSTQHFNSHELLPKQNYRFTISTCTFLKTEFKPVFYKETDTQIYLHFSSFHADHCKSQESNGEHLRSVRNNTPGFPVAQHFNSAGHSIADVQVQCMRLCRGSNIANNWK